MSIAMTASVVFVAGRGVVVAGRHVDERRAGSMVGAPQMPPPAGPHVCTPDAFLRFRLRLFGDRVRLPDHRSRRGIERRHAAAERAALVARDASLAFFTDARRRHVDAILIDRQRSGRARVRMIVNLAPPDLAAGVRIDRVRDRGAVREVHREAVRRRRLVRTHAHRRADAGLRVIAPVLTSPLRVERDDVAAFAGDEHAAAEDRGLRSRGVDAGEAVGPLQLQSRHRGRREAGFGCRLKPRVGRRPRPTRSIPLSSAEA